MIGRVGCLVFPPGQAPSTETAPCLLCHLRFRLLAGTVASHDVPGAAIVALSQAGHQVGELVVVYLQAKPRGDHAGHVARADQLVAKHSLGGSNGGLVSRSRACVEVEDTRHPTVRLAILAAVHCQNCGVPAVGCLDRIPRLADTRRRSARGGAGAAQVRVCRAARRDPHRGPPA